MSTGNLKFTGSIFGTDANNEFIGGDDTVYYGLSGNDIFTAIRNFSDKVYWVGGTGNDTYRFDGYGWTIIHENGGDDNDQYYALAGVDPSYVITYQIDGRHLVIEDYYNSEHAVVFIDWQSSSSRIEQFHTILGSYSYDGFRDLVLDPSVYIGDISAYNLPYSASDISSLQALINEISQNGVELESRKDATQDDANAIARLYLAAFDRLPDIDGLNHWIDTYENGMAVKDIAANFYASAEFKAKYGDPADIDFISQLYSNVLDRDPDLGGLSNWQTALNEGTSRADVLLNFADSAENKANAAVYFSNMSQSAGDWSYTYEASISDAQSVARLYQSAFNRTPDEAGLNSWIDHFENGMSIKSIAKAFSESAEFISLYGNPTDGEFVTLLYQNVLHRTPDAEGYSNNVNALSAISRVDLLVSFSESNESIVNTNSQFSGMYESGDIWYGF